MTEEEALRLLSEPIEDFKVGNHAYYSQYEEKVLEVVVVAKRESKIGLQPCYSLYCKELDKTIRTPLCYIYKNKYRAKRSWEAIKLIKSKQEQDL